MFFNEDFINHFVQFCARTCQEVGVTSPSINSCRYEDFLATVVVKYEVQSFDIHEMTDLKVRVTEIEIIKPEDKEHNSNISLRQREAEYLCDVLESNLPGLIVTEWKAFQKAI